MLAVGSASAQDAEQGAPVAKPWCDTAASAASADSLQLNIVWVPSEYAQVKARTILEFAPFVELNKDMAADLGVPETYLQPHAYLARVGGFFQPEGDPGRQVEAYYDPDNGMLQIDSFASSVSTTPINWAAIVVAPGEVATERSVCVSTDTGR
jgi:hypothetical protein